MADTEKEATNVPADNTNEPGQVIAPGGQTTAAPKTSAPAPPPQSQAVPAPLPVPTNEAPETAAPDDRPAAAPFAEEALKPHATGGVSWTASEFIAHEKSAGWYAALAAGTAVFAGLVFLLTRDYISTGVVVVCALVLGVYGSRKPRQLQYRLDDAGIQVGPKRYLYSDFRSFAIMPEGAFSSIVFMPLKRFAPLLTIYYAPDDEDKIVDALANWLPNEERHYDAVDLLMRRIRF